MVLRVLSGGSSNSRRSPTGLGADLAEVHHARRGWDALDLELILTGLLDGSLSLPEPEVGLVEGGQPLFVRGALNGLHSAPGLGKTLIMQYIAGQEIERGHTVWFLDFEDKPITTIGRMLQLGFDRQLIAEHLRYRQPDEPLSGAALKHFRAQLLGDRPSLVIVDSIGVWMGLNSIEDRDDKVSRFWAHYVLPLADAGAAVVLLDHVPHREKRRHAPIGSQRKIAAIGGCQYLVEGISGARLKREAHGGAQLTVAKDRTGTRAEGSVAAEFYLDDTGRQANGRLCAPASAGDWPTARPRASVVRVRAVLAAAPGPMGIPEIVAASSVGGQKPLARRTVEGACAALRELGQAAPTVIRGVNRWELTASPAPGED